MPIRGSTVEHATTFKDDLARLRPKYPEIDDVVDEFSTVLRIGGEWPEIPIDDIPEVYVRLLDYPPLRNMGLQRFRVTYHATDPDPSPTTPYRSFTLLTISERS